MKSALDEAILTKLSDSLRIDKNLIKEMESFFYSKIKPEIKKNYLSHLKTSIEDLINEKQKRDLISSLKENPLEKTLERVLFTKQLKLFTILLIPISSAIQANTRIVKGSALIYYSQSLDEKQKRILIAHELGHIVLKYLIGSNSEQENYASLFSFFAMIDKNRFYQKESKDYVYTSEVQLLNEIINVCRY